MTALPTEPAPLDPGDQRRALLERLLTTGRAAAVPADTIPRAPRQGPLPLSFGQQRLWLLENLRPGTAEYVVPIGWELHGPLDVTALRRALAALLERHEVLRTRYLENDSVPGQLPLPAGELDFELIELGGPQGLAELVEAQARTPFDLGGRGPVRARLVRFTDVHHALLLTFHHIAFDGASAGLLARELGLLYPAFAERDGTVPAAPAIQYADFAAWQRRPGAEAATAGQLAYWREQLAGATALELACDRARPAVFDPAGALHPFTVPAELARQLTAFGRSRGATPFMVLLAAFQLLLAQHAGRTDVTVGSPVAGRTRAEVQDLIGFFVNTLVLRTDLSGTPSFAEAVDRVRQTALRAYEHQDVPFERLVEELAPERDLSRNPLFQVMFALNGPGELGFGGAGVRATALELPWHSAKFDLTLHLTERGDGSLLGRLEYATALFEPETAALLADQFTVLLAAVARDPHAPVTGATLLGEREAERLAGWNATERRYPEGEVLHELVRAQAARTPEAVAVRFEGEQLTYRELLARAERLASRLRAAGVGPERVVAVCLHRSSELPTALLAVLLAGGAYLPLDPGYPAERLGHMLADSAAPVLLTSSDLVAGLPAHRASVVLADRQDDSVVDRFVPVAVDPLHPAYVIYTSGSTGRPKGVVVEHRGIVNRLRWMQDAYGLTADDRVLQKTPYSFDVSVWELFWPLLTGATLVVARPDGHRDPGYLTATMVAERITTAHFVPSMLRVFLAELSDRTELAPLRRVVCSGEALPDDLARAFLHHPATAHAELHNLYGPTEASVDVTAAACRPGERVTIGRPVSNTRIHVLDRDLGPLPVRVPGQLCLAGVQLARGYLGRPALTAERFVPDPDPRHPGARLYLTGDLAHLNPDATVSYRGRADHQVKLNGHRIELGEIEAVLRTHPEVADAVVTLSGQPGAQRLTAHVVPATAGAAPDPALLRRHLRAQLPEPMVPTGWTSLARIPLTANGKLDQRALPAVDAPAPSGGAAPRTPLEHLIAEAWATALETDRVGVHDSFFELGGDSIRAIRTVGRLRRHGLDLTVQDLFRYRTVAELAAAVAPRGAGEQPPAPAPFALLGEADRALLPSDLVDAYPLSQVQAGMAFEMLAGADRGSYLNTLGYPVRDDAPFSAEALRTAAALLADRHEILRTSVDLTGYSEPLQLVHRSAPIELLHLDLRELSGPDRQQALAAAAEREQFTPFDLARPSLLRLGAWQLDDRTWQLVVSYAHTILDGWSQNSLVPELLGYYRAVRDGRDPAPAAPPAARFADTIALERRSLADERDREFWRDRVERFPVLRVPEGWSAAARRAEDEPVVHRMVRVEFHDLLPGLRAVAGAAGVPVKSVLFAAHLTVLGLIGGRTRGGTAFSTGLVCNARPETVDGDQVRGMFLNTVPFGHAPTAASWPELARAVFAEETALWPHRHFPLPAMQHAWGQGRPLVEVFFNYTDMHVLAEADLDSAAVDDRTPNEFGLSVSTVPGVLVLEASSDRIGAAELDLLARCYRQVLAGLVADPQADPRRCTLPEPDRGALLAHRQPPPLERPDQDVTALFTAQVARTPEQPAVVCGAAVLSYRALDERVGALAALLDGAGVRPGDVVGLFLHRGTDLPAAMLAVLSLGAAYLPIDPELPEDRIGYLLADTGAAVVLTQRASAARLAALPTPPQRLLPVDGADPDGAALPRTPRPAPRAADPDDLAYVIHTSGSTGRPKGVMVTRRGLADFLTGMQELLRIRAGSRVAALTTASFDPSVLELYLPLLVGATVVLADTEQTRDPQRMTALLAETGPAVVQATPVTLRMLLDAGWRPGPEQLLLSGGEKLAAELARRLTADGAQLCDLYGPTETTVWATVARVAPDGTAADCAALPGTRLLVLDHRLEPVPDGVVGEIHLGGAGEARGYHGRPGLTAAAFLPDPHHCGGRLYRTGDLGRFGPDGRLELLGRADHQVKIRGHRIEPGEIEAVLLADPRVRTAVVHPVDLGTGGVELVGYLVPEPGRCAPEADELRGQLARTLPEYMVPAAFVVLPTLPLTPTGKIDRRALPVPERADGQQEFVAPRTEPERLVAAAWREVLGLDRIGVHESFFDLGGHSLLATRISLRLRETAGRDVPVRALFDRTTVAALAAALPDYPEYLAAAAVPLLAGRRRRGTGAAR
ncbi:amino acid adenylation domain-containing protein [Kitasatospora sp. NPDC058965]|uniref:amino acid adenylation domain-containing protein n=1 Tax=Kitasatospora sp. NPDC058965 TaxID=3346682 RepID=UPI0036A57A5F